MSGPERIAIQPAVMAWARTSAGLDVADAARRLTVSEDTLRGWESGDRQPTVRQLRNAAAVFKRPLAVLLLPSPPRDFQPLQDFRLTDGLRDEHNVSWSPALHAEIKRAITQREVFLELAELSPGSLVTGTDRPALSPDQPAEEAGAYLRRFTGIDQFPERTWSDSHAALNASVAVVERLGIIVAQTRGVAISEMRGFSISEWPYAVVALNGSDWPRPRLFTLFHELGHLALNAGGLCDLHETRTRARENDAVEHYCNEVAASALLPAEMLLADAEIRSASRSHQWSLDDLRTLSTRYGPSSEAILLRLIAVGKATWDLYWTRKPELEEAYQYARQAERERRTVASGGPSYYVVKARDLGHGYASAVLDAYHARAITSLDVADYLDVRFDQLPKLEAVLR